MNIEEIISQLESLKENSKSFIEKGENNQIWEDDVRACDNAIAILKMLWVAGITEPRQVGNFLERKAAGSSDDKVSRCFFCEHGITIEVNGKTQVRCELKEVCCCKNFVRVRSRYNVSK